MGTLLKIRATRRGEGPYGRGQTGMKLSVISPTYNEAENVRPFVEAVRQALQGRDYEIWIVDDDSPDCTWQLAEELRKEFPELRVLRRTRDRGLDGPSRMVSSRRAGRSLPASMRTSNTTQAFFR